MTDKNSKDSALNNEQLEKVSGGNMSMPLPLSPSLPVPPSTSWPHLEDSSQQSQASQVTFTCGGCGGTIQLTRSTNIDNPQLAICPRCVIDYHVDFQNKSITGRGNYFSSDVVWM